MGEIIKADIYFIRERPLVVLVKRPREDEIKAWLKTHAIDRYESWIAGNGYNWKGEDGLRYWLDWLTVDMAYVVFHFERIEDVVFFKMGYG